MAIEVIVVGGGQRGKDWIRALQSSKGFALAACVDSDREVLNKTGGDLNILSDRLFENLSEAIAKTRCQAVIVATPADRHVVPCETALLNTLPVLVEKPFTLHLDEARKLVELAEHQNVPLLVAQNYRYMRSFRATRKLIEQGTLGPLNLIACQYFRPFHAGSHCHLEHSVLFGMSVHHLDVLRYVLGADVTSVVAESFSRRPEQSPSGASFRAMLEFEKGIRALYAATYESSGHEFFERGQEFYARFVGERATLHLFHRWLILCERRKLPRLIRRGPRKFTEEQFLLQQLQRAISGEPTDVSGRDNLQTMAVLEACIQSAKEQRWINPQHLLNGSH